MANTVDNLKEAFAGESQAAFDGETYEATKMYPPMLRQAETEAHAAKRMFGYALKAEAVHAKLYKAALDAVRSGKDVAEGIYYVCSVCGHIEAGRAPGTCPICGARAEKFTRV